MYRREEKHCEQSEKKGRESGGDEEKLHGQRGVERGGGWRG